MWSAPAKVTFPDGRTVVDVVFGEYEIEDGLTTMAVFVLATNRDAYVAQGGFGTGSDLVLLETDIHDSADLSGIDDDPFMVQRLDTSAGAVIVDWRR